MQQNGYTALMKAVYKGHLAVSELLIEKKAHLNIQQEVRYSNTRLHWSCCNGFDNTVKRQGAILVELIRFSC